MSKKVVVVKLDLRDGKDKRKAIKAVAAIVGVDAVSVDMKSQQMTVVGTVDPVKVMSKLRKASFPATLVSVGPVKEPEKKDGDGEKKKEGDGEKKDGEGEKKKDGNGEKKEGDGDKKKEDGDAEKKSTAPAPPPTEQIVAELMSQYRGYYHPYTTPPPPHYYVQSMEENPNSCVIC